MARVPDFLSRRDLNANFKGDIRLLRAFEQQSQLVEANTQATSVAVAATDTLRDATYVTLSANAELPNERVLQAGTGIRLVTTADAVIVQTSAIVPTINGGFAATLTVSGATNVALPLSGRLATVENAETLSNKTLASPKVSGLGDYADDAAAASGGVSVGGLYRTASAIKIRVA